MRRFYRRNYVSNRCHCSIGEWNLVVQNQCCSAHTAEEARSGFIGPVRQISMFADLYREGKEIVLEGPDRETVEKLADILNHSAEELLEK